MTTLPNYCTYSVQTIKKFYVTLKGKLGIHIRITMCKIKFWISGCSDITRLKTTRECRFLSIIVDKGADVSKKEQLLFCLWPVDENLNAFEDFINFYLLENIKSDTIVYVIKDILIRMNLSLSNCRGQTYDGASNMMGKKSGVLTHILAEQPKAVDIHCQRHSLRM